MRLTNPTRQKIIEAVLKEKIQAKVDEERAKVCVIAQEVADGIYPKKVKDWIDAAPDGGLVSVKSIKIAVEGNAFWHPLFNQKIVPGRHLYSDNKFSIERAVSLLNVDAYNSAYKAKPSQKTKLRAISKRLNKLEAKREAVERVLNSALYSSSTIKLLQERFPSIAKYIPSSSAVSMALVISDKDVASVIK